MKDDKKSDPMSYLFTENEPVMTIIHQRANPNVDIFSLIGREILFTLKHPLTEPSTRRIQLFFQAIPAPMMPSYVILLV
jgi:hypothetical protein